MVEALSFDRLRLFEKQIRKKKMKKLKLPWHVAATLVFIASIETVPVSAQQVPISELLFPAGRKYKLRKERKACSHFENNGLPVPVKKRCYLKQSTREIFLFKYN